MKAPQAPVANNDSGFSTTANTAVTIAASALLANDTDPGGLALSITGVSAPVNGTVSYNTTTQTVTFTPNANYTGAASFTYSIADTAGGAASASVALSVTGSTATESLFSASATPATLNVNDTQRGRTGRKIHGRRQWRDHRHRILQGALQYRDPRRRSLELDGELLATATFTTSTASGWQQVEFTTPVAITAGATYIAAYHTSVGEYSATGNYFTSNVVSGDLTAPASGNGVYAYGASDTFPTSTYNATNYWVDVVYSKSTGARSRRSPTTTAALATELNTPLTINASQLLANDTDPNGLPMSFTGVSNPATDVQL